MRSWEAMYPGGFNQIDNGVQGSVTVFTGASEQHPPEGSPLRNFLEGFRFAMSDLPIRSTLLPFSGVAAGRQFLIQVPGVSQSTLSDAELADLLNWMIENLSNEPRAVVFKRFTGAEVASYRRKPLVEVRATREGLLNATGIEEMTQGAKK